MKRSEHEQHFLDLLDGTLPGPERARLEEEMETNPQLRAAFEAYRHVVAIERRIADESHQAAPSFAVKVMDRIENDEVGFLRRLFMAWNHSQRVVGSSIALAATVVLVFVLTKDTKPSDYRLQKEHAPAPAAEQALKQPLPAQQKNTVKGNQPGANRLVSEQDANRGAGASEGVTTENDRRPPAAAEDSYSSAADKVQLKDLKEKADSSLGQQAWTEGSATEALDAVRKSLDASATGTAPKRAERQESEFGARENRPRTSPPSKHRSRGPIDPQPLEQQATAGAPAERVAAEKFAAKPGAVAQGLAKGSSEKLAANSSSPERSFKREAAPVEEAEEMTAPTASSRDGASVETRGPASHGFAAGGVAPSLGDDGRWQAPEEQKRADVPRRQAAVPASATRPLADSLSLPQPADPAVLPPPPAPRQNVDEDNYRSVEEHPRVATRDEPMSTFSVDVDTASYTNARRFILAGNRPPKDSVRIEEFINYFDYGYPTQSEKPFQLTYEIAPSPLEPDRLLLLLGIKAREAKAEQTPWNLTFLIDTSGSMMPPERLELIKKGLRVLVSRMRPEDRVSIVTYAGNAGLALDATPAKEAAKILAAIDGLHAGGSTNGSGGIALAYEVNERHKIARGVNRVVLATDGDFNVGVTSQDSLVRLIEEKRKSGITLTTLGVGTDNIKDARLEALADKGNGNYFYLDSFQEARRVLGDKIAGTMEVVAKDVKLQIEFNPDHVAHYRLIGYDNRKLAKQDFANDAIDAGEVGVGHTVTAIYELVLTDTELAKRLKTEYRYQTATSLPETASRSDFAPELAFLKIRYKEPDGAVSSLLEFPIEVAKIKKKAEDASVDFRFASAVAYFGTLLRESQFAGNYRFHDIEILAESSLGDDKSGQRREFVNLVKDVEASSR